MVVEHMPLVVVIFTVLGFYLPAYPVDQTSKSFTILTSHPFDIALEYQKVFCFNKDIELGKLSIIVFPSNGSSVQKIRGGSRHRHTAHIRQPVEAIS